MQSLMHKYQIIILYNQFDVIFLFELLKRILSQHTAFAISF